MPQRIRVTCELDVAGHRVPDAYYDLPDNWDQMSKDEQQALLTDYAQEELTNYATSGACVVDENGEPVDE